MRPSRISFTWSAMARRVESWVAATTVMPRVSTISRNSPKIDWALVESSSPVGSSARMRGGLVTMARAMETRCCSPPESS